MKWRSPQRCRSTHWPSLTPRYAKKNTPLKRSSTALREATKATCSSFREIHSSTIFVAIRASKRSCRRLLAGNNEVRQLFRRAEAAQRLQSCGRVRGCRVAVDSGGVDFLPGLRRAALGDEDIYHRHHLRLSGGADFFLGVRNYAGRNQTRI